MKTNEQQQQQSLVKHFSVIGVREAQRAACECGCKALQSTYIYWAAPFLVADCMNVAPTVTLKSSPLRVHSCRQRAHSVFTPEKQKIGMHRNENLWQKLKAIALGLMCLSHASLVCLHRHRLRGPSCTTNNPPLRGRIRAELDVEPRLSDTCVNGWPVRAGQGQVFILTEEK